MSFSNDPSSSENLIKTVKNIDTQLRVALNAESNLNKKIHSATQMCFMLISSVIRAHGEGAAEEDLFTLLLDLVKSLDVLIELNGEDESSLNLNKVLYFVNHIKKALNIETYSAEINSKENRFGNFHAELRHLRKEIILVKESIKVFDIGSKSKVENLLAHMQEKCDQISSIEKEAQKKFVEITGSLEQNSQKIAETVGRLSTDAVSGRFNGRALEEKTSAERMQWAAIILMCFAISLVFLSALKVVDYWGWQDLLVRSLTTITLFITAGYFANEANKHRRLQHKYERIHLDLSAIDPFIVTFDDETQRTLKSEVARRVFVTSHGEDSAKVVSKDDIPTNLAEVMGEMLKVLKTLNKKEG